MAVAHPLWGYPRVFYEIFTVRVTVTSVRQGSKVDLHENPAVSNVTTCCAAAAAAVAAITHGPFHKRLLPAHPVLDSTHAPQNEDRGATTHRPAPRNAMTDAG